MNRVSCPGELTVADRLSCTLIMKYGVKISQQSMRDRAGVRWFSLLERKSLSQEGLFRHTERVEVFLVRHWQ